MKRDLIYYSISSTVVAFIAQALGAGFAVTIVSVLVAPPLILLAWRIFRR